VAINYLQKQTLFRQNNDSGTTLEASCQNANGSRRKNKIFSEEAIRRNSRNYAEMSQKKTEEKKFPQPFTDGIPNNVVSMYDLLSSGI
jgi:hypothetical protein